MAYSNTAPISSEEEHGFCVVCFEPYDDDSHKAKFLQCHHTFCSECLTDLASGSRGKQVACPACRLETRLPEQGVDGLQTNYYLKKSEIKSTEPTEEVSKKDENVAPIYICDEHYLQNSFFCKTCSKAICSDCISIDHMSTNGHIVTGIGTAVNETRHTLQDQVNQSHITMTQLQGAIQQIEGELQKLDASKASTINDFHKFIQSLQQQLDECKEKVTNDISQQHQTEQNELLGKKIKFQETVKLLISDSTQSQEIVETGGINELKSCMEKLKEINENTRSDFKLFYQIRSCFASDVISGGILNNNLCDTGERCLQSNFPTSVHWTTNDATAGLGSVIVVELLNDAGNEVPFAASFLTIKITDPRDKELPAALSTTHPDCTVTFTPQRSGKHKVSIWYLGKELIHKECIIVKSNDPVLKFGKKGRGNGSLNLPGSIRIDNNNSLYVTDQGNSLIQQFTSDGKFLRQFPVNVNGVKYCALDMAVDDDNGRILCPDVYSGVFNYYKGNKVLVFDEEGSLKHKDTNNNNMYVGNYITINNRGDIIISDYDTNSIYIHDKQGNLISEIKKPQVLLDHPSFLCTQKDNSIILSDTGNHCIKILNPEGKYMYQVGSYGKKPGQLAHPLGVATDGQNILVADSDNHRIQVFKLDGTFVSMIESHSDPLNQPRGLAVTRDGHVYVVDSNQHCIKKYKYMDIP